MSEILSALGLTGAVTAVEISDTRLFSASDETGAWIVTAHRPFSTTEWMKVTINGVVYDITVTDDQATWSTSWTCEEDTTFSDGVSVTNNVTLTVNEGVTLTINGGVEIASGKALTVEGPGTLIIYGASTSTTFGGYFGAGIGGGTACAAGSMLTINGGNVEATGGTYAAGIGAGNKGTGGTLTVGFASASDSLKASSYNCAVTVAAGKVLTDGSAYYAGELSGDEKSAIAGKMLVKNDTAYIIHKSAAEHGTVSSPSAALPDATVTLTVTPEAGWGLDTILPLKADNPAESFPP